MRNIGLVLMSMMMFVSLGTFAQKGKGGKKGGKMKIVKQELDAYFNAEIYPSLKTIHTDMNSKLSAEDKATVATVQSELKALKVEKEALRAKMKAEFKASKDKEAVKAANAGEVEALKVKAKAAKSKIKPVVQNNKELLQATAEQVKPYYEQLKTKRQALMEQHLSPEQLEKMKAKKEAHKAKHGDKKKNHRPIVKFLLWDGEMR